MRLVICEKPSVAKSIASALGVTSRADGYFEGGGWLISWCIGHLVGLAGAVAYDDRYKKWRYEDLPILPDPFRYVVSEEKAAQFYILRSLMERPDVLALVNDEGYPTTMRFCPPWSWKRRMFLHCLWASAIFFCWSAASCYVRRRSPLSMKRSRPPSIVADIPSRQKESRCFPRAGGPSRRCSVPP